MSPTPALAATTQQELGALIVAVLLVGWAVYIVSHLRRPESLPPGSEIELAPNRKKYFDDEALEGPKLDRSLGWALVLLSIVAIGLPMYWLKEPGRQSQALNGFDKKAAHRGFLLFQPADSPIPAGNVGHFGCAGCHGSQGQGGAASFGISDPLNPKAAPKQVQWKAPALNTVALRYSDEAIRAVLVYGRAGSPMPAWGVLGGGPMNDQQINDLIAYLHSIVLKPAAAKDEAVKAYGQVEGKVLFEGFCARCHTKGFSYDAPELAGGGAYGPNLTNGDTLRQFPNIEDHVTFIQESAEYGKPYGTRGIGQNGGGGMPAFGKMLTEQQIRAIVDYERSL